MTELQTKVFNKAKEELSKEPWFRGVCLDNLPDDADIKRDGVQASADQLVVDTAFWDDPKVFSR